MNRIKLYNFRRLDSIFMDITKSVLRRLDKDKIPLGLLPSLYPGILSLCFNFIIHS